MKFGSVCSGIEAASIAWESLGWKAQWFSEIEGFPNDLLSSRHPDVPNLGDMTKITEKELFNERPIDLLVGGTPCQSFSLAGLRKGLGDPRGNLTLHFLKILNAKRPKWMVWENVPGVLSSWSDAEAGPEGSVWQTNDFDTFTSGLRELGYGIAWRVLDAQYFGVPQRRRRVFVVGYLGDWRRAAAVLFERHSLSGNSPPSREAWSQITGTLTSRATSGGGFGGDFECDGGLIPEVSNTLLAKEGLSHDSSQDTLIAHTLRGEGYDASEDGTGRGTPIVPVPFDTTQITSNQNRSNPKPGDACHTLPAKAHPPAIAFSCKDYGADAGLIAHDWQVRRLTPRECERLQGFPDDYTLIDRKGKPAADGPRYKAIGNSMAVPVMRWIGERIQKVQEGP